MIFEIIRVTYSISNPRNCFCEWFLLIKIILPINDKICNEHLQWTFAMNICNERLQCWNKSTFLNAAQQQENWKRCLHKIDTIYHDTMTFNVIQNLFFQYYIFVHIMNVSHLRWFQIFEKYKVPNWWFIDTKVYGRYDTLRKIIIISKSSVESDNFALRSDVFMRIQKISKLRPFYVFYNDFLEIFIFMLIWKSLKFCFLIEILLFNRNFAFQSKFSDSNNESLPK